MCCHDEIMGLNDAAFSLSSCDSMWGVYKADVFWKSLAQTVPLVFIVVPSFTPAGAATLVSPGSYSLLDGKRQLGLFHRQYTIVSGSPVGCDTSDAAWVPPWKEKTVSAALSAPTTALQRSLLPIPNAQHHPAFQGVLVVSCCVNLPRLLLFWGLYTARPSPPASVRGYRCRTHRWENSQDFCVHLLHTFASALFRFAFFQWERNKKHLTLSPPQGPNAAVQSCKMPSLHLCITATSLELCFNLTARRAFLNLDNF